jgi:hypothetical protein
LFRLLVMGVQVLDIQYGGLAANGTYVATSACALALAIQLHGGSRWPIP